MLCCWWCIYFFYLKYLWETKFHMPMCCCFCCRIYTSSFGCAFFYLQIFLPCYFLCYLENHSACECVLYFFISFFSLTFWISFLHVVVRPLFKQKLILLWLKIARLKLYTFSTFLSYSFYVCVFVFLCIKRAYYI
jgi:hypothetical protein